jgi:hypothetical protein
MRDECSFREEDADSWAVVVVLTSIAGMLRGQADMEVLRSACVDAKHSLATARDHYSVPLTLALAVVLAAVLVLGMAAETVPDPTADLVGLVMGKLVKQSEDTD